MADKRKATRAGVEYEHVGHDYLEERALTRYAGVLLIWALGVGYVISGEYFSWNFGFDAGGVGGFAIATVLMATMYITMIFCVSEMATSLPHTGGPYAFARRALGPWGGFATGLGAVIEYVLATAAISVAIGFYIIALPPFDTAPNLGPLEPIEWIAIASYVVFLAINLLGVRETLWSVFAVTIVSVVMLLIWGLALIPEWSASAFTDIAVDEGKAGASKFLPFGIAGILGALPFAIWFYLAIEGTPLASEETRNPERDLPRGTILAMFSLVFFSAVAFFFGGGVSAEGIRAAGNPLPEAWRVAQAGVGAPETEGKDWFFWVITVVGLTGLIASFHSIIFAYSRITYSLSRAGYLPRILSITGGRRTPYIALILPAVVGWGIVFAYNRIDPDTAIPNIVQISVFGALVTYVLMMASFIVLRRREPNLRRAYRAPGGEATAAVALLLAVLAMSAGFFYTAAARWTIIATIGAILVGLAYFALYSRHRLVAEAPEEEFALIEAAEAELEGPEPEPGPAQGS
jgi:ethanolamine permease